MSSIEGTVLLNNYLQKHNRQTQLSWEDTDAGPHHAPEWTSTCKLGGDIIATGTGSTKAAARDAAANEAFKILTKRSDVDATDA